MNVQHWIDRQDDEGCLRCNTGCGEHSCWRQQVSQRVGKPAESIRQRELQPKVLRPITMPIRYGKQRGL